MSDEQPDTGRALPPQWDPAVRAEVMAAIGRLELEMRDLLWRLLPRGGHAWDTAPPEVAMPVIRLEAHMRDVLFRYFTEDGYELPSETAELGDVTGLLETARVQLVEPLQRRVDEVTSMRDGGSYALRVAAQRHLAEPLQRRVDEVKTAIMAAYEAVDEPKRRRYGEAYQPVRPQW